MDYLHKIWIALCHIEESLRILASNLQQQAGTRPEKEVCTDLQAHQWMDRLAVQEYLQISQRTFFRLKKEGQLRPRRIGGRDYFFKPDLIAALQISILKGRL